MDPIASDTQSNSRTVLFPEAQSIRISWPHAIKVSSFEPLKLESLNWLFRGWNMRQHLTGFHITCESGFQGVLSFSVLNAQTRATSAWVSFLSLLWGLTGFAVWLVSSLMLALAVIKGAPTVTATCKADTRAVQGSMVEIPGCLLK